MIKANHLLHRYGDFTAIRNVTFEIPRGQIVGMVGPNGAGKSTTMKILTGFLAPTEGTAEIAGKDVVEHREAAARHVGYLPESAPIYRDMSVQDYLTFMAKMREVPARDRRARLSEVVHACSLEDRLTTPVGHLSKGFRQRVGLAQAMIHDPDVLILDEPSSGLDPTQILDIRGTIRRLGETKTVVLSTHILSEVQATCDRAIMIVAGQVHVDEPMETFREGHSLRVGLMGRVDALSALGNLSGITNVELLSQSDEETTLRLKTDGSAGLLSHVGLFAKEKGWVVTELTREVRDLEDIFKKLHSTEGVLA